MPRVGFEPTTPVFKRAKTVHTLRRAATVIGNLGTYTKEKWDNFGKTSQNFNITQAETRHWTAYCDSSILFNVYNVIDWDPI
jgi:hypothetical protein